MSCINNKVALQYNYAQLLIARDYYRGRWDWNDLYEMTIRGRRRSRLPLGIYYLLSADGELFLDGTALLHR